MRKLRDVSKAKLCRHSCSEVMSLNMTPQWYQQCCGLRGSSFFIFHSEGLEKLR